MGVLTFSIGFGKPIYQWQRGETTWQIAMIPLGGFVRMMDETEAPIADSAKQKAFNNKHPLQKIAVVLAGPLANLLFAVVAVSICYLVGVKTLKAEIATVQPASIAYKAGVVAGDQVISVGGRPIDSWDQLQVELFDYAGAQTVALELRNKTGNTRSVELPLGAVSADKFDQHLLSRLGLSPFYSRTILAAVQTGGAAAKAGLQVGDTIVAVNQLPVKTWAEIQAAVLASNGRSISIEVERKGQMQQFNVTPIVELVDGVQVPRLGIAPEADRFKNQAQQLTIELSPVAAVQMGVKKTYQMAVLTLRMFGKMLIGVLSPKQVSGPIGIAEYAGQSASLGWLAYLQFLALISISLGVLNLLPVPILDGGHLLYHSYELLTGKLVPASVTEWLQKIGLTLLLMLMALALFNDTSRLLLG